MLKVLTSALSVLTVTASLAAPVHAEDIKIRVLGWYGNQPQSQQVERPFWKELNARSNGQFSTNFRTIDELNLKGFESLRTLKSGAFDILSFQVSFVGGEAPILMGVDLPGAAFDFDQLQKNIDAYRPILEKELDTRFNAKLLAAWSFPFQILYCKGDVKSLDDLRGKKVRVSGTYTAKLAADLGAAGVTLAGPEVYQGLMQGVVDCAITGSQYGNSNDWFEVSDTLSPIPLGGAGVVLTVARNAFWQKLSPEQQTTLAAEMKNMETDLWKIGRQGHEDGVNCNTGIQPCDGKPGKMTLIPPTDADKRKVQSLLASSIVPLWTEDCAKFTKTCGEDWMNTIGAAAGIKQ
ncbi:TRAP transporter substrate-binding protein [Pollutimonas bauzanensis]|uniref:TRAP transporter substrate-binding protein n=1 Tax=Pollutimonas bauzanensis TaxID=658167 RepID=UPI00333E6737